jgi:tRNA modification GTPase
MRDFSTADTIVAVATPPGRGGIGVVRLAGPDAHAIACALTGREEPLEPRHATFARVVEPVGDMSSKAAPVDQVIVTWFAAPHSYTGDDVVEVSGHGSPVLLERVVQLAMRRGARLAQPGEFTFRAYLNGRIDLVQAEAVADLIEAVTPRQARAAMDQLEGTLTTVIGGIDAALFDLAARLEASLDFPEEGFHFVTRDAAIAELGRIAERLADLCRTGRMGRVLREGRLVVIAGRPNAGKSSVFNALAGSGRAIVTDIAGTTRDVLTEVVDVGGVPVTLVDTAGLREARDAIEAEGVARARQATRVAALSLVVIDRATPIGDEDRQLLASAGPIVVVLNKSDLPRAWLPADLPTPSGVACVDVSALTGEGIDDVRAAILDALSGAETYRDAPAISNVRHLALAERAFDAVSDVRSALAAGATEELALADLQAARQALEEITGRRSPDDLLHHIFGKFCIGK